MNTNADQVAKMVKSSESIIANVIREQISHLVAHAKIHPRGLNVEIVCREQPRGDGSLGVDRVEVSEVKLLFTAG